MSSSTNEQLTLKSSDGELFTVDIDVATQSKTIQSFIEDAVAPAGVIPTPKVNAKTLTMVIEYCKKHVTTTTTTTGTEDLKKWDADFVKVDQSALFDLIMAANFLNVPSLLDLICQTVADMIKGKKPDEIRETLKIGNDFTPEEDAQIRRENAWAFE